MMKGYDTVWQKYTNEILIVFYLISILIFINLVYKIIKRSKGEKNLFVIKRKFPVEDIGNMLLRIFFVLFMLFIEMNKYSDFLVLLKISKSKGILTSYDSHEYLRSVIGSSIFVILLVINDLYNFYNNKMELLILSEDGISILGVFDKWNKIKAFYWESNKLILKVEAKFFSKRWLINREVDVPTEHREKIEVIINNYRIKVKAKLYIK
jgi:hypothetical protein